MEKIIQHLVRKWKGEALDPHFKEEDSSGAASELPQELEIIWQKAAHYKANDFEPDVAANWKKFQTKIQQDQPQQETPVRRMIPRTWLAAAAAIALVLTAWFFLDRHAKPSSFSTVATHQRQIKKVELPDQSIVWLSKNSELSFDEQLDQAAIRTVKLRGEAYFEVNANANTPFQIETPHGMVEVLGTSFNVRALQTEAQTEVQVMSGRVALMSKAADAKRIEVPANYIGYISTKDQSAPSKKLAARRDAFASTAIWRTRKIDLSGRPLAEAQEIMRRYSDYRLEFSNPLLAECVFTWTLQLDNPEASLRLLVKTGNYQLIKTSTGIFRLVGEACPR